MTSSLHDKLAKNHRRTANPISSYFIFPFFTFRFLLMNEALLRCEGGRPALSEIYVFFYSFHPDFSSAPSPNSSKLIFHMNYNKSDLERKKNEIKENKKRCRDNKWIGRLDACERNRIL